MKKLVVDAVIVGFALFAMFFGAGNIIFPPSLGVASGAEWLTSFFFYFMADVGLALVAIFAMLKAGSIDHVEGIMIRLGKVPARILMGAAVICIGPLLAVPRTAVISYEMAGAPYIGNDYLTFFAVGYFGLCFLLSIRESKLVDIVGIFLTPALVIGLITMIVVGVVNPIGPIAPTPKIDNVIWQSIIDGYQTLDVLAALIFGLIVINALKRRGHTSEAGKFTATISASLIAGTVLFIIYGGLCYLGATASTMYPVDVNKGQLVIELAGLVLGSSGQVVLSVVVLLACITTAVALIGSTGTFFSTLTNGKLSYNLIVTITCIFSTVVANFGLAFILQISVPILMIIYPGALTVVVLSLFNNMITNDNIFRGATFVAVFIGTCDVLKASIPALGFVDSLPLASMSLSWVVPAIIGGVVGAFIKTQKA